VYKILEEFDRTWDIFKIRLVRNSYMPLPDSLQQAIDRELSHFHFSEIAQAREELTNRYRQQSFKPSFMTSPVHRCAYLATRLPATYAVIIQVLREIQARLPEKKIRSVLDLGAGPGTAMWAACAIFPEIEQVTLIEKDPALAALGQRLAKDGKYPGMKNAQWRVEDLEHLSNLPAHDLVILSYSIGELNSAHLSILLQTYWKATSQCLVVIEPGTPVGFERIRGIRSQLFQMGGHPVAPCPHALACPMTGGDWCHFSERIERTSFHRRLKGGTLGHEDEKYSYIAVSKENCPLPQTRVLRHPLHRSGHVHLVLCTAQGIKEEIISKRHPIAYKQARKLDWGSPYSAKEE
jgi:ribosomal protein RSM22 (predicted rRNA methylase)